MHSILALDFDGVICDSAPENAATAWRCCRGLWPELFRGEVPQEQIQRFCQELRPYMETGYQSILQTWLLWSKAPLSRATTEFAANLDAVLADAKQDKASLKTLFGGERDRWLSEDENGWLSYNRFYPGAADSLRELLSRADVRILTTKEERFVSRLMAREGVDFPEEKIFGLGRIRNKQETLLEWSREGALVFVEDRLATLQRMEGIAGLEKTALVFADWGYSTPEQRGVAAADPRIRVIENPSRLKELV
jgi:phosphoglycolate phosphatase-like HAD superfamily hydrolase